MQKSECANIKPTLPKYLFTFVSLQTCFSGQYKFMQMYFPCRYIVNTSVGEVTFKVLCYNIVLLPKKYLILIKCLSALSILMSFYGK